MNHIPVLLENVLETLGDIRGRTIVDATFGAGGYSRAFLERGANVIAFDRDTSVATIAEEVKREYGDKFEFINAPFSEICCLPPPGGGAEIRHIVFDLGISSMQIDEGRRGFSFRFDGPLDMRMGMGRQKAEDKRRKYLSAADFIAEYSVEDLSKILREYGDVKKAGPIARAMKEKLPRTTFELRDLIYDPKDIAPVFQALRIAVNDELGEIGRALDSIPAMLPVGGICICVSFHSLEDRLVKHIFREWTTPPGDPRLPDIGANANLPKFKLLKTFTPSESELSANPRARSAHLRAVIKSY